MTKIYNTTIRLVLYSHKLPSATLQEPYGYFKPINIFEAFKIILECELSLDDIKIVSNEAIFLEFNKYVNN
jgi:hypothetical protein